MNEHPVTTALKREQRRYFLSRATSGVGVAALATLLRRESQANEATQLGFPNFPAK